MDEIDPLENARREVEQLKLALKTRDHIGVAKGMLMMRYQLTEAKAFAFLTRRSMNDNVKVHDLAKQIIVELSAESQITDSQ